MKLGTRKSEVRDGELIVASRDLRFAVSAKGIARCLQDAIDRWSSVRKDLQSLSDAVNLYSECGGGGWSSSSNVMPFPVNISDLDAPLPRAYQWADASGYLHHVELVRRARGAEMPPDAETNPIMYQGASDRFLAPEEPVRFAHEDWGIDCEAEVAVITSDIPAGSNANQCAEKILFVTLVNDTTLRNIAPAELKKGFGFFNSKPLTTMAPFVVTPDELGDSWSGRRVALDLIVHRNDELLGAPNAGVDLTFDFAMLLEHAAKTRPLGAGTIMGSGTVSNRDRSKGSCCIAEKRMIEIIESGSARTQFLKHGETIRIEMKTETGESIFGAINQQIQILG